MVFSFCEKDQVFLPPFFSLNLQSVPLPQRNCGQVLVPAGWVQSLNLGAEAKRPRGAGSGCCFPDFVGGPGHPGDHSLAPARVP